MWNWLKSWWKQSTPDNNVQFPNITITVKPDPNINGQFLIHFVFNWPDTTTDNTLIEYYGRALAHLESGKLVNVMLNAFNIAYKNKYKNSNGEIVAHAIHHKYQQTLEKLQINNNNMLYNPRDPIMLPSDVLNFKNKMNPN